VEYFQLRDDKAKAVDCYFAAAANQEVSDVLDVHCRGAPES
jgi:hypothetical protein